MLFMRIMGKRQMGELELPELIVAVLIADLGAHPLQDIGIPLMNGLLPIIVLFCCEVLLAGVAIKSVKLRGILFGKPSFLIRRGVIDQREMRNNRFTLDELTQELRENNVSDISTIEYAILETNGKLNIMLFPEEMPARAKDVGVTIPDAGYPLIVINEGRVLSDNLRVLGKEDKWLEKELRKRGVATAQDVYFMALDHANNIYFAAMEGKR